MHARRVFAVFVNVFGRIDVALTAVQAGLAVVGTSNGVLVDSTPPYAVVAPAFNLNPVGSIVVQVADMATTSQVGARGCGRGRHSGKDECVKGKAGECLGLSLLLMLRLILFSLPSFFLAYFAFLSASCMWVLSHFICLP